MRIVSPVLRLSIGVLEGVVAYARSAGSIRIDVAVPGLIVPRFVDAGLEQLDLDDYRKP